MEEQSVKCMKFVSIDKHQQYQQEIVPLLNDLAQKKFSSKQVLNVLRKFKMYTSMTRQYDKYAYQFGIKELYGAYEKQIPQIFSKLSKIILQNKQNLEIPILQSKKSNEISFNKKQIVYLMSLMTLNLIPHQQYCQNVKRRSRFPSTNDFSYIFDQEQYKTKTIIEYFNKYFEDKNEAKDQEVFSIRRQVLFDKIQKIIEQNKELPMKPYQITQNSDSIENYYGQAKVDFANKYIGGGALHSGCVQQQIMFANHPQLFTSVLFCEVMEPNEALFLTGYKKYSKNNGYAWNTTYGGKQNFKYPVDELKRPKQYIIAVDAIHFSRSKYPDQAQPQAINRQLTKAYVGFNIPENIDIVTGNWGCGAFNGEVRLKFLIQWLACSLAKKKMIYCPFGMKQKLERNSQVLQSLSKKNVGQVYQLLIGGGKSMKHMQENIFQKIQQLL